jgi:uncharacterized protein (DUF3084 family)
LIDKSLSEVFDIEAETPKGVVKQLVINDDVAKTDVTKVESDFDDARKNLQILLMQGEDALMGALEVAKQSEHPRAFEVVGNLIKQLADVNQQLMDLHKQKQQLEGTNESGSKKSVTNNNAIFVGSTTDLNKMIHKLTKGD